MAPRSGLQQQGKMETVNTTVSIYELDVKLHHQTIVFRR